MEKHITVRLYSPFSDVAGCRELTLPATAPVSAASFLRHMGELYPALQPYLAEGGDQGGHFLLVIDGRLARMNEEEVVRPGDEVYLCAQISGG